MEIFDNRYEQEVLLGRGAFSEVWKVRDTQTGVTLALKIYNSASGAGENGNEMLTHEFALMVNVSHKNLLRPLFFATCNNRPYLILPYCGKGNIGKMVGKMSEDEAWKLLRDCASALAYLHAMNPPILHQDIKPANILMGDNGEYMLTDFGVSTQVKATLSRVSNQELALYSAGTISYMAPERFSRNNLPVMANDIYSLGSTVYEMLTGYLPFGNDGGLLQKKGADIPELQGDFSPLLKRTLEECLQAEPWDRPTAEDLEEIANDAIRHPLNRFKVEEPVVADTEKLKPTTLQIPVEYLDSFSKNDSSKKYFNQAPAPQNQAPTSQSNNAKSGNNIGETVVAGSDAPQRDKAKKNYFAIKAVVAFVFLVLLAGIALLIWNGFSDDATAQKDFTESVDSLTKEQREFEECRQLFALDSSDSIHYALNRMIALAELGNKEAAHEVAFTYAWTLEKESVRRKELLGWKMNNETKLPESVDINKEAVKWLEKSIQLSDSKDYKALYWLSFYYYYGICVKEDTSKALAMLNIASKEAENNHDLEYKKKIDDIISNIKPQKE